MLIEFDGDKSLTVYALLFSAGKVYNPSTGNMDALSGPLDAATYGAALTEDSVRLGYYSRSVGSLPVELYSVEYFKQVGGSRDFAADFKLGAVEFYYDGATAFTEQSLSTIYDLLIALQTAVGGLTGGSGGGSSLPDVAQLLKDIEALVRNTYYLLNTGRR